MPHCISSYNMIIFVKNCSSCAHWLTQQDDHHVVLVNSFAFPAYEPFSFANQAKNKSFADISEIILIPETPYHHAIVCINVIMKWVFGQNMNCVNSITFSKWHSGIHCINKSKAHNSNLVKLCVASIPPNNHQIRSHYTHDTDTFCQSYGK